MTTRLIFDRKSESQLLHAIRELPRRVGIKHLRIALNAMGGVGRAKAREKVRQRTKALHRSLSVKVVIPAASYNTAHHHKPSRVLVGADRRAVRPAIRRGGKVRLLGLKRATKLALQGVRVRTIKPSRYAHLVEDVEAFIAPAQRAMETTGMTKLREKLTTGIAQEASALAGNT